MDRSGVGVGAVLVAVLPQAASAAHSARAATDVRMGSLLVAPSISAREHLRMPARQRTLTSMAQVVAHDGTRLLVFTRSAQPHPDRPLIHYGRILDLPTLRLWPEMYLDSLAAHGQWEPLDDPLPVDRLLAMAGVQPLA